ncbi:hypothetical protein LQZ18_07000 [Lachnospiraceae bacterium ZAX-1]
MIFITYVSLFLTFSVFTSVFIDRSLTYHILFYTVEKSELSEDECAEIFDAPAYKNQRLHDMINGHYLKETENGMYVPTAKAKVFVFFMSKLGKFYRINDTYDNVHDYIEKAVKY